ncbi:response regulator transcription factor [Rheinheimera baltica]|uniref:Response regulator transcription factor n=1 Tax=Rheinheimera baltica TaxID=67576 RepID=A0ABT9HXU0_9GAMM|nr:response regulator transcription factor [Rheinheimera baltica]MDP5135949.1 response regulator transcription factor [Rheinheimera baltica]MDP5151441.1 response regulator transcription factor [Rheinheimera baltica]MDP5189338.1 response regulator transcription factor [Rheinheimera baltica]
MPAILMIDDDTGLCDLVAQYLALDGYQFTAAHDGKHGLELAQNGAFELILLDIMLPGMDGLSVLKTLRVNNYCPVLMLTARGDEVDRIVGLELGADDYLAKPFNPRELVARIKAILRRVELTREQPADLNSVLHLNELVLNPHNRQLCCNDEVINLTATEFQLLEMLMRRAGDVVSKDELSRAVLGKRLQMYDRSLDMHISNIRKKIAPYSSHEKIQTLRGTGYLFIQGDA